MEVRFKICGLTKASDARLAEEVGARYGGVILSAGSPRTVSPAVALATFADSRLLRAGVFVDEPAERVALLAAELRLDVLQLHGDESPEYLDDLRSKVTSGADGRVVAIWKAIRTRSGSDAADAARRYLGFIDGLHLDGWSAAARGGTGITFPWREVAAHRDTIDPAVRLIVAGGLTPDNVAEAIGVLAPDIVDVSSGVEIAPGVKDPELVRRFAHAVKGVATRQGAAR
jgi:phosphoribosylanthranilate isomerase